ncbi:hypothetical protein MC7420_729 [Coleofasciculus chthonoplastes PCC 7420]|uniref:Uncharacterized protein n=1 Tax=Coleofasciculus chthonoplastes PCC 7420 TaxID=118168 RepID=B4VSU1_9CYAN|nr:hypothetical protein MC7420_729 [Coleofasciculus chthonoplastes PCC 7420]
MREAREQGWRGAGEIFPNCSHRFYFEFCKTPQVFNRLNKILMFI